MGEFLGSSQLISRTKADGATVWPVTLDQFKRHAQITHTDDDVLICNGDSGLICDATEQIEQRAQVALVKQTRRLVLDCLPEIIELPFPPLISVIAIKYLDSNYTEQTVSSSLYRVSSNGMLGKVIFKSLSSIPSPVDEPESAWVDFYAGYGDTAAAVPARWQQIIMEYAMTKYERREPGAGGGLDEAFERMIDRMIISAGAIRRGV